MLAAAPGRYGGVGHFPCAHLYGPSWQPSSSASGTGTLIRRASAMSQMTTVRLSQPRHHQRPTATPERSEAEVPMARKKRLGFGSRHMGSKT
jgi:hypothetical protein